MQEILKQKIAQCSAWLGAWCKDNIDFAFVLAVFTETPRWTVTFMAIHEPLIIGVPLGVLLAFATSKVWKHYFHTRSWSMLIFNILAIVLAVAVISPVLYAMTEHAPDAIRIATVLPDPLWRAAWAVALALTTFVPLVQLAVVHGAQISVVQSAKVPVEHKEKLHSVQDEVPAQPEPDNAQPAADAQPDKRQRARQMHLEGISKAQIARDLGVHRNTVQLWTSNGVQP